MRLVLREYLSSLKEDGELDTFIGELLRSMGIIPMSKIQRGRQFGVDIPAVGRDTDNTRKVFLFTIKQGNLNRKIWDGGNPTDVRPSLNEILDVFIKTRIPEPFNSLKKKIIVCSNGFLDQTVIENWSQFVNANSTDNIEIVFWGIDNLIDLALQYQMNESIIPPEMALAFRRALSFIDLPDYNLFHFYKFLNGIFLKTEQKISNKEAIKKMRLLNLCLFIIHSWCSKSGNLKPAYIASERIILNAWGWIVINSLENEKTVLPEYHKIVVAWRNLAHSYIIKVRDAFNEQDGLSRGIRDHKEYCLITYEQIGILSTVALYEIWVTKITLTVEGEVGLRIAEDSYQNAEAIAETLCILIGNNPASNYPKYDEHCIEITLALSVMYELGFFPFASKWLKDLIEYFFLNHKIANFVPLFYTDVEKLDAKASEQKSSILITVLAEWCLILKQKGQYIALREFIKSMLPDIDLQLWFPDEDIDSYLFSSDASKQTGNTMVSIDLPENFYELEMAIAEERIKLNSEKQSSMTKHGIDFLQYVAFRHFRTYPFPNSWRQYLSTNFCFNN